MAFVAFPRPIPEGTLRSHRSCAKFFERALRDVLLTRIQTVGAARNPQRFSDLAPRSGYIVIEPDDTAGVMLQAQRSSPMIRFT